MHKAFPLAAAVLAPLLLSPTISRAAQPPAPLPPAEAPRHMTLPEGFNVTLFAGEPDVVQPIAFAFDDRGRLWVGEALAYPQWDKSGSLTGHDRIEIFEDTTGSGHFDKKTTFADNLPNLSGFEIGFGGVYVCSTPHLLFVPRNEGEDKPSGPPQVLLDGWNVENCQHNVFNHLTWGPDGWLYGLNGIQSKSKVGKPGTADAERVAFDCGVWRYHPITRAFEVVARGTTNPWGLDFDEYGQGFITNCVINHLWHVIPGAHYQRMYGQDAPEVYSLMTPCADHLHWVGGDWTKARGGEEHSDAGGGHAHVGAMVYLGDNWPDRYRNSLFTCNLHGNRVNNDILEQHGSGYVGRHGKDFLLANDPWFRGIDAHYGPDGGVFVSDWTDTGECHNHQVVDRTNGRVYKVTYGKVTPVRVDLSKKTDAELVALQLHKNDWFVVHARRLLEEHFAAGKLDAAARPALLKILNENPDVTRKLRALWCLHATGGIDAKVTEELLAKPEPYLRGWAIQLALEGRQPTPQLLAKLAELAKDDPSPAVRLFLASGLQRLPNDQRWLIAAALLAHAEDAADKDLPLMDWFAAAPLAEADPARAADLIAKAKLPLVRGYLARRLTSLADSSSQGSEKIAAEKLSPVLHALDAGDDPQIRRDILRGMFEAYTGRRRVPMPEGWPAVYRNLLAGDNAEVRDGATSLALIYGDPAAFDTLRKTAADASADAKRRAAAVGELVRARDPAVKPLLQELFKDPAARPFAIKGLAEVGDDKTPALLLEHYAAFTTAEKQDAVNALASRAAFAAALLDAVESGKVARSDLSAYTVRQLVGLNNAPLTDRVKKVWGESRPTTADKKAQVAKLKGELSADALKRADLLHGRSVFARTCAQCHTLFDAGGNVGPNLTGSQRGNLDYLLENVVDPNAIVPRDYYMTVVDTKDGRTITGVIKEESDAALVLRTPTGDTSIPKPEIEKRKTQPVSLMPEGLLQGLKPDEVRDLIGYLQGANQVALPEEKPPVKP